MSKLKCDLLSTIPANHISRLAKSGDELLTQEYDDSSELYNCILRFSRNNIDSDDFLELVYDMLIACKMHSRGARLCALTDIKKTIAKQADIIQSLAKYNLEKAKATNNSFNETVDSLFDNLRLTQMNTLLVTFLKTMHFLLPDIFMPIDRRYTLRFFYESTPVNQKQCFF